MFKAFAGPLEVKADAPEGSVRAAFSIFNTIDSSRDVVLPSAFEDGQEVLMAAAHDWGKPAIGKGVIRVERDRAVFDGSFFMDTNAGRDWYGAVKNAGKLQQWSFGYEVLDSEAGTFEGKAVQFLKKVRTFEVSPVMVGDNQRTYTVGIKSGQPIIEQIEGVQAALGDLVARFGSLAELRAKEGRVLSEANRRRLSTLADAMRSALVEVDDLLSASERRQVDDATDDGDVADDAVALVAVAADMTESTETVPEGKAASPDLDLAAIAAAHCERLVRYAIAVGDD